MLKYLITGIAFLSLSFNAFAVESLYCPQNSGYIRVGMTPDQVLEACGRPFSHQPSDKPVMQKVPMTQFIYNNLGAETAFYGVWSIPTGVTGGAQLEVNVIDNKVYSARLNGRGINAFSICGDESIQMGDPVEKVYGACGTPSIVNNTYINQPVQSNYRPEIWIYQVDQYQPPFRLTFVNGKLQSID